MNPRHHHRIAAGLVALALGATACGERPSAEDGASTAVPPAVPKAMAPAPASVAAPPTAGAVDVTAGHAALHGATGLTWSGLTQEFVAAELLGHPANTHQMDGHVHAIVDPLSGREATRLIEIEMARMARGNGGALTLQDDLTGEALDLEFVRVQPPILVLAEHALFAVTLARRLDGPDEMLALDTWIGDGGSGLAVLGFRVQAVRQGVRREDGPWTVRYERHVEGLRPVMTDEERTAARDEGDLPAPRTTP